MKSVPIIISVLVLSLAVWVYFFEADMPLTAPETTVVVGVCLAFALLVRWAWVKFRTAQKNKERPAAKAKSPAIAIAFALGTAGFMAGADRACAQIDQTFAPPPTSSLACSPETPVVLPDGSIALHAWTSSPLPPEAYKWVVPVGEVVGRGSGVQWKFQGAASGMYRADLTVTTESGTATCAIRVVVTEPNRGSVERHTARTFLIPRQPEEASFGLYSYVLFGSRPSPTTRVRYLGVLQAYLNKIDDVVKLEQYVAPPKLNVTYVLLESSAPETADAAWILDHYDFARARVLLDSLPGNRKDGIYLVSCMKPLSESPGPPYVVQDLTTVPTDPPDLISWWMREFLNQAAQERFWEPKTAEVLTLKLRTSIAILAAGLPDVQKSLSSWINWIH